MWVGVHCWSVVPADEHASCTSRLPVSFCSISGHACEGKDMHRPCTSHKQQRTASGRGNSNCASASNRTLELRILYMHTMHTCTHARTHARTHAHTHAHTHTRTHARTHTRTHARTQSQNSLCPLAMVNILCIMGTML